MTKRAAMTMAVVLSTALLAGVTWVTLMVGGVPIANAGDATRPTIKHEVQTITVHRKAKGGDAPTVVRVIQLPATSSGSATAGYEDQQGENENDQGDDSQGDSQDNSGSGSQGQYGDD